MYALRLLAQELDETYASEPSWESPNGFILPPRTDGVVSF